MANDTIVIAAFGDSLTSGFGVAPKDSFPAQLERTLRARGYKVIVYNDGINGDTTDRGVFRYQHVIEQKPQLVIIELGANDYLKAVEPARISKNLETIMSAFSQANIPMVLAGMKASEDVGYDYATAYDQLFVNLASRYHAELYPFFLEGVYNHGDLMQPDGLHPNARGVSVIVKNILPHIESSIQR